MTRHRRSVVVVLVVAVVAGSAAIAPVGTASPPWFVFGEAQPAPDAVVFEVSLGPDGSADWRIELRFRLEDRNATAAFESLRREQESHPLTAVAPIYRRLSRAVAASEEATGREMALRNLSVNATRGGLAVEYGIVVYTFEWTSFGRVEDDGRIVAGDALEDFFIEEDARLLLSWPDGYRPVEVVPGPDAERNGTAVWSGRREFAPDRPRVVVEPTDRVDRGRDLPVAPDLAGRLVAGGVLAALVVAAWRRRRDGRDEAGGEESPDEELLTDEERVLELLAERGGRMRQQAVVEAFGWSETKTSEVVRELRADGRIEVVRLGRENVLALPGEIDV